jgi:2,3-dihydroxy-p-cumate/2,3-dihydroxybenzoate 3,4-dioxygenase
MERQFRFRQLAYVSLSVTDLDRSAAFYTDIVGLECVDRRPDWVLLRCSDQHHEVELSCGPGIGVRRIGWLMESPRDLQQLERSVRDEGLRIDAVSAAECDRLGQGTSIRVRDPSCGLQHEFFADRVEVATRWRPSVASIARLGHVVVVVRDLDGFLQFTRRINFRVSDSIPDFAAWLRCFPNVLHHSLAVQKSTDDRLHHVNFMVDSVDDIGRAINRLRSAGVPIVFGPGRHLPSQSIFLYFTDPDGLTLEYSVGMEEFDETGAREPRSLELSGHTLDTWGGRPEAGFGAQGIIEQGD